MDMGFFQPVKKGFTLIEILVAVAIIGVLASIILANVGEARKKARDTERASDLQQIQLALRTYKDSNGRYPTSGCGRNPNYAGVNPTYGGCQTYIEGFTSFFQTLPIDPTPNINYGYIYRTNAAGTEYKLMAYQTVESKKPVNATDPFARYDASCVGMYPLSASNQRNYAVWHDSSPGDGAGAECW
jgi:type II secretion system protein G